MMPIDTKERMDNVVPTPIAQWLLAPYLEFSLRFGGKDKKLLDCACGNMYQKPILDDRFEEVFYVDKIFPELFADTYQIDLETEKLPWIDNYFDVVFSFETIEHLTPERQLLFVEELTRVGKSVIIGSVSSDGPNYIGEHIVYKSAMRMNPYHKREFRADEWKDFFDTNLLYTEKFFPYYHHLVLGESGFEIKSGLDPKNGISNYVRLQR